MELRRQATSVLEAVAMVSVGKTKGITYFLFKYFWGHLILKLALTLSTSTLQVAPHVGFRVNLRSISI
jgi:hypothetical protein